MTKILDVICTNCKWEGKEDTLNVVRANNSSTEYCPKCGSSNHLQDNELEDFHDAINDMWNFD